MPILSIGNSKGGRSDKGAILVYVILALMILMATTFAGGSIALSGIGSNSLYHSSPTVLQGEIKGSSPGQ